MKQLSIALVGLALVAATTHSPQGPRFFGYTAPPNPTPIRLLGRSHVSLVADVFWIRAIGISVNLKVPADGLALVQWCDFVTRLDPRFLYPYIFGGLMGPMTTALGNHNVAEANQLMQRGIDEIPTDHRLPIYLSYNQLHLDKDFKAAAETLRRGARIPGAPYFMGALATRLLAQTNDFEAAQAFASELEANSPDPEVREVFARRKLEIERDRRLDVLQAGVDRFKAERGRLPESLMQLLSEGFLRELPPDPLGGDFILGEDGTVIAPSGSRLKAFFQGVE